MLNEGDALARGLPLRAPKRGGGLIHYRGDPVVKSWNSVGWGLPWVGRSRLLGPLRGGRGEGLLGQQPGLQRFWEKRVLDRHRLPSPSLLHRRTGIRQRLKAGPLVLEVG